MLHAALLCPAIGSHFPQSFILAIGASSNATPLSSAPCLSYLKSNLMQMGSQMPQVSTASLLLCPLPSLLLHAYAVSTTLLLPEACAVPIPFSLAHAVPTTPLFSQACLCCAHSSLLPRAHAVFLKFLPFFPTKNVFLHYIYSIIFSTHFLVKLCHVDFYKPILRRTFGYRSLILIADA